MFRIGVASLILLSLGGGPGAQDRERNRQSDFTGEIKPVLYVSDVQASARFYRDVLGFDFDGFSNRSDGTPYYAEMLAGKQKFGLHEPIQESQKSRVGQARLYFRVGSLKTDRERIAERGTQPGPILETDWMDMFIVPDPDGNEIVFAVTDPSRHSIDPW